MRGVIIKTLFALSAFFLLMAGRTAYLERRHFDEAERYFKESNIKLALREYETAMHFHAPFSPYRERAARRLFEMGEALEAEGKPDWALMAYSGLRSSFYAARGLYTPGRDWIRKCDEKTASLSVKILLDEGRLNAERAGEMKARILSLYAEDKAPDALWSFLAVMGLLGFSGAVLLTIFKGMDRDGRANKTFVMYGILFSAVFFFLWVAAMIKA